jgi:uncharacterized protein YycO
MGWYLSNSFGGNGDVVCNFGVASDKVITGDWNGDGLDSPGVFRNGTWYLSNSCGGTGDYIFGFGDWNDVPVVGDWDGNGTDTPGVFRNGMWYLSNGFNGQVNYSFGYGNWDDVPVVGDWDGNGTDTPGIFRGANWALSNGFNSQVNYSFVYGVAGDIPVVADWDGNGTDTPGIVRGATWTVSNYFGGTGSHTFNYGAPGDTFFGGDWNGGSGPESPGVTRPGDVEAVYNVETSNANATPLNVTYRPAPAVEDDGTTSARLGDGDGDGDVPMPYAARRGDIFYYPSSSYGFNHAHTGIYRWRGVVVEAANDRLGVRKISVAERNTVTGGIPGSGSYVAQVYTSSWSDRVTATNWANDQDGKGYRGATSRNRTQSAPFNCSQLVWAAYNRVGFDLDEDGGWYVLPRNIIEDTDNVAYYWRS